MYYIQNFTTTDNYTAGKTSFEYPNVSLTNDDSVVHYMGDPYWTVQFNVTADDISNETAIPIYCCYRSYAAGVESTYEHACGLSDVKSIYYNGVDIISQLGDTTISKYNKPAKTYTFDTSEEAGFKEFIFVFKDSYHAPTGLWADCTKLVSAVCSKAVEILPAQLFYDTSVENIKVGKDITFVGQQVSTTSSLKSLTFEDGGTESLIIGKQLLENYGGTEIILPDRCTQVGHLFCKAGTLTKVVFGPNITDIGVKIPLTGGSYTNEGALFMNCNSLETIIFKSVTPPTFHNDSSNITSEAAGHMFRTCSKITAKTAHIYVPAASVDAYKAANGFSEYADMIEANPDE